MFRCDRPSCANALFAESAEDCQAKCRACRGLGDWVAFAINLTAGLFSVTVEEKLACGCVRRRRKLNRFGVKLLNALKRK